MLPGITLCLPRSILLLNITNTTHNLPYFHYFLDIFAIIV
jgi:hypothetical protein